MPDAAALPRWFIMVRRDKPMLYQHLRERYRGDNRVEVIVDRRRATSPEIPPEANLRRAERRIRDRRAAALDNRRQAERRQPLAHSQQDFWVNEGFFMVRRSPDTPTP
jgi:hypothetical protein